jgi:predicted NBD/HSP70 family sugar kinase
MDIYGGQAPMLDWIMKEFQRLLAKLGRTPRDVLGVGLGLPAQIDFASGRVVAPSLMTGWEDFDICGWFRGKIDAPIIVENEVNLVAISEHCRWPHVNDLFS